MSTRPSILWVEDQADNHAWLTDTLRSEFPGQLYKANYSDGLAFPMRAALRLLCEVLHADGSGATPACPRLVILDSELSNDTSGHREENDHALARYKETLPQLASDIDDCLSSLHGTALLRLLYKHFFSRNRSMRVVFVSRFREDEIRTLQDEQSALRECPGLLSGYFRKDPAGAGYLVSMLRDVLDDPRRGFGLDEIRSRLHKEDADFFLGPAPRPYEWSAAYRRALSDLARAGDDKAAPFGKQAAPHFVSVSREPDVFRKVASSHRRLPRALILGNRGTGKERFARAIHNMWYRDSAGGPFQAVNIGGVPPWSAGLAMQLRLFGGRLDARTDVGYGCVPQAWNGTVFLDELGDAQKDVQDTLLRLIQEGEYEPVLQPPDLWAAHCAFVGATNREVYGPGVAFRTDVADRLAMYLVRIPEFNSEETREDVPLWMQKVAEDNSSTLAASGVSIPRDFEFSEAAANVIQGYSWPGNLREFKHALRRMQMRSKDAPSGRIALSAVVSEMARLRREHERNEELPGARLPEGEVEYSAVVAAAAEYLASEQKRQVSKQSLVRFFGERMPERPSLYQVQSHFDRGFAGGFGRFLADVAREARLSLRRSPEGAESGEPNS